MRQRSFRECGRQIASTSHLPMQFPHFVQRHAHAHIDTHLALMILCFFEALLHRLHRWMHQGCAAHAVLQTIDHGRTVLHIVHTERPIQHSSIHLTSFYDTYFFKLASRVHNLSSACDRSHQSLGMGGSHDTCASPAFGENASCEKNHVVARRRGSQAPQPIAVRVADVRDATCRARRSPSKTPPLA